jgi:hypothetical protein
MSHLLFLFLLFHPARSNLADRWKIEGPRAVVEKDPSSSFRLEYTVSSKSKFARYKTFQKGCQEEYADGVGDEKNGVQSPVKGTGEPVGEAGKSLLSMTLSPDSSSSTDDQIASVSFEIPNISKKAESFSSFSIADLVSMASSYFSSGRTTLEFCIRMGLWLPPEAGENEVNFRETNVKVTLQADTYSVLNVELEDCPMNEIDVIIAGSKMKADMAEKDEEASLRTSDSQEKEEGGELKAQEMTEEL